MRSRLAGPVAAALVVALAAAVGGQTVPADGEARVTALELIRDPATLHAREQTAARPES